MIAFGLVGGALWLGVMLTLSVAGFGLAAGFWLLGLVLSIAADLARRFERPEFEPGPEAKPGVIELRLDRRSGIWQ